MPVRIGRLPVLRDSLIVPTIAVPLLLATASGLLVGASFRIVPLSAFVALVPLLLLVRRGVGAAVAGGWACGVVAYATVFTWLPQALAGFAGVSVLRGWAYFAAGVGCHAVQFAEFAGAVAVVTGGLAGDRSQRRSPVTAARTDGQGALVIAGTWVLLDWAFPKVVPWTLGGALAPELPLRQAADLGGAYLLDFVIAGVNASLALALMRWVDGEARRARDLVGAGLGMVTALFAYGAWSATAGRAGATAERIAALLVQGAIEPATRHSDDGRLATWRAYQELTEAHLAAHRAQAAPHALIVWPESTLTLNLRDHPGYRQELEALATRAGSALLIGAYDRDARTGVEFNSAFVFAPSLGGSGAVSVYHKRSLVPWAEYAPASDWLPALQSGRRARTFAPGADRGPFAIPAVRAAAVPPASVAPSICFEALRSGGFNAMVAQGARLLVNITDDGWLAGSAAPDLHLQAARMRAVETRRWMLRASNSGISAVIDPRGEIVASLPFGVAGVLNEIVPLAEGRTLYVRWGDWPLWVSAAIVLCALGKRMLPARRGPTSPS